MKTIGFGMNGNTCLSNCPYKKSDYTVIKIASLYCQNCDKNKGINRENKTVDCIGDERNITIAST
jgi:hypothetical protein